MDFDYSVATEDRFNLRKWFEEFTDSQNNPDDQAEKPYFSEKLIVEGFTQQDLNREAYLNFLKEQKEKGNITQIRYPEMKLKYKNESFLCSGTFEAFADNILSYEGTIDIEVIKEGDNFIADYIKFYPRLKIAE
jgi:hypothetical protein